MPRHQGLAIDSRQLLVSAKSSRVRLGATMVCTAALLVACEPASDTPITVRLIDHFDRAVVEGTVPIEVPEPTLWRFDGEGTLPVPEESPETVGWRVASGIEGLAVEEGLLVGRTDIDEPPADPQRFALEEGELPALSATLPDLPNAEFLHAVEVRMRASEGTQVGVWFGPEPEAPQRARLDFDILRMVSMPLEPGPEFRTYRLTTDGFPLPLQDRGQWLRIRSIMLEPTDADGADFAIESIRLISRKEHLRSIATGPGWQGLGYVERETLVSRSPKPT